MLNEFRISRAAAARSSKIFDQNFTLNVGFFVMRLSSYLEAATQIQGLYVWEVGINDSKENLLDVKPVLRVIASSYV